MFQSDYGKVSTKSFDELYTTFITKSPFQDTYEARVEFLRQIYLNKGIAEKAQKEGVNLTVQDSVTLGFYKMKLLTELLWEKEIDEKLPEPTEKELRETFKKMHTKLKVGNIFSTTKSVLDSVAKEIANGQISFEEAAKNHYKNLDSTIAENAGFDKFFGYGEMDFEFEEVAYNLKKNEVSEVFRSTYGFHLIKLKSVKEEVIIQESDFQQRKSDVAKSFKNRRNKNETDKFVRKQFAEKDVRIKTDALFKLKEYVIPYLKGEIDSESLRLNLVAQQENSLLSKNDILATFGEQKLSVEEFLFYLPSLSSRIMKQNFLNTVETVIEYKMLSKMAIEKGFGEDFVIREKVEIEKERMMKNRFFQNEFAKVDTSEKILMKFFDENKHIFTKNPTFDLVKFTSDKPISKKDFENQIHLKKLNKQLKVDTLKSTEIDRIPLIKNSEKAITFGVGNFIGEFYDEKDKKYVIFEVLDKQEINFQEKRKVVKDLFFEMELKSIKTTIERFIGSNGNLKFSKEKLENL